MRPNILILISDQLGKRSLSCYGNKDISTTNIDKMASAGIIFQNACSTYPVCVPFRFTLMTGEYAHTRNVPAIEWTMSPAERTLADEFNDAGYETVYKVFILSLFQSTGLMPTFITRYGAACVQKVSNTL